MTSSFHVVSIVSGVIVIWLFFLFMAGWDQKGAVVRYVITMLQTETSIVVDYDSTMFDEGYASLPMAVISFNKWLGCDCVVEVYVLMCILN